MPRISTRIERWTGKTIQRSIWFLIPHGRANENRHGYGDSPPKSLRRPVEAVVEEPDALFLAGIANIT